MRVSTGPLLALAVLAVLPSCGGSGDSMVIPSSPPPTGSCATEAVANEGWVHVVEGAAIGYRHNPPASGPHYPVWARYEEHAAPLARGYWVHDLEHGGIVFLYRPGAAAATIDALRAAYRSTPNDPACGHKRALLAPDSDLPGDTAVIAADFVLQSGCTDNAAIQSFVTVHRGHGPEQICDNGTRP